MLNQKMLKNRILDEVKGVLVTGVIEDGSAEDAGIEGK